MFVYLQDYPGLEVHYQIAEPSVEALEAHVAHVAERTAQRAALPQEQQRYYVIQVTGSQFRAANASERKVLGEWLKRDFDEMKERMVGACFVMDSMIARGALTAVFWLSTLPAPYHVEATLDRAVARARSMMSDAGLPLPPVLDEGGAAVIEAEFQRRMGAVSEAAGA